MRIINIFLLNLIIATAVAQEKVSITGTILDDTSGEPLEFASVSLHNPSDTSLITGDVTNAQGNFTISVVPGNYLLRAQFVSYLPQYKRVNAQEDRNVGTISLSQDVETLSEVVVTGHKDQMQLELDKRVFNVSENINNIGISASQILDNLPSISVDVDGNVALRGSQNVRILINGRPSGLVGLSGTDALRQLQGNLIESIEVVTNPSARYDAEGSAGIINIILKKKRDEGFNGAFTLNTGWPHDHGISANVNYRRDKFNLFLNYGINYDERPGGGYSRQHFFFPDSTYFTNIDRDRVRKGLSNTVRFGSEFFLSDKSTLTASFTMRISDEENVSEITYEDLTESGTLLHHTNRKDIETEDDDNFEYQLSYQRDFEGEGHKLTADLQYRTNDEIEASDITETNLVNGGDLATNQRSVNDQWNSNFMLQADYVNPFRDGMKIETGYRGTLQEINSDYVVEEFEDGNWVNLENFTNEFAYDEQIHAAYAIFENKMDKWGYQLGMRVEHTEIGIFQANTNDRNNKSYTNAFPSAFLSFKVTDENSLQASYSRRLSRPRFWYLNPFFSFSDRRNIRTGNVDLDPEFTDSYEAGYLRNKDNYSLYFGGFYRHTTQVIDRVSYPLRIEEETFMFFQPHNIGIENAYGLEMNFSTDPTNWLNINGNANFYRAVTDGLFQYDSLGETRTIELGRETYTANFRLNTRLNLDPYNIQLSGRYNAPEEDTQGTTKARYSIDLGANRDILNNKATITLSIRDLFNTRRYRGTTAGEHFFMESEFQWRARQINFSFTYRLNQKKQRNRGERGEGGDFEGGEDMGF